MPSMAPFLYIIANIGTNESHFEVQADYVRNHRYEPTTLLVQSQKGVNEIWNANTNVEHDSECVVCRKELM